MKKRILGFMILFTLGLSFNTINITHANAQYASGLVKDKTSVPMIGGDIPKGTEIPASVDMTSMVPKPGDQGSQGSCTAWSVSYAARSTAYNAYNGTNMAFSPSYVYNQIKTPDGGSSISDAFNLLKNQGVVPISLMPYNQYNDTIQPTSQQRQEASKYKIYGGFGIAANLNTIKSNLADGNTVITAMPIYSDLYRLNSTNNTSYDSSAGAMQGYHAVLIIGYNDVTRQFKFINSWGLGWGSRGYGYLSYDFVTALNTDATDSNNIFCYILKENKIDKVTINIPKSTSNITFDESATITYLNGESPLSVKFPVWTTKNGQDDIDWRNGQKTSTNTWKTTVNIADHNMENGSYQTTVIAVNKAGISKTVGSGTTNVNVIPKKILYNSFNVPTLEKQNVFTITAKNVRAQDGSAVKAVKFPVWTDLNGEDDLVWYTGKKIAGTNDWVATIRTSEHKNENGLYTIQMYAIDSNGLLSSCLVTKKTTVNAPIKNVTLSMRAHVESYGWMPWKIGNEEPATSSNYIEIGTTGKGKRVEAMDIKVVGLPQGATVSARAHVQSYGWMPTKTGTNIEIGTIGKAKRMESIILKLNNAPGYHIVYQAHVQSYGWMPWVKDGAMAGTSGKGLRVEALRIKIVKD